MKIIKTILADFLSESKISVEITGFDMEKFSQALHRDLSQKLDMIEHIVYEDEGIIPNEEKIVIIKQLFEREFYSKE